MIKIKIIKIEYLGTVDYIFQWKINKNSKIIAQSICEIPPTSSFEAPDKGIPNDSYASDHFYVQCKFQLSE